MKVEEDVTTTTLTVTTSAAVTCQIKKTNYSTVTFIIFTVILLL